MANDLEQLVLTISADTRQMQRALARLVGDTDAAARQVDNAFGGKGAARGFDVTAAAANRAAVGVKGMGKEIVQSGSLAKHELINLSRQVQDVGVSLVSGQSPFTVLVQQGTQIADIFGSSRTGTVGGALKQIGSGIVSVITPMRLLGVGVVAAGAGAAAAYASWKSFTLQLDDAAKSVGTTTGSLSKLQAAASFKGIAADDFTKGIQDFGKGVYDAKNNMGGLAEVMRVNNKRASDFDGYLDNAADLIKNAASDQQRLVLLQQMGLPATMQWVRLLSGGKEGLEAAKKAAAEFAANDELIRKAREFDEAWNKAWTNFGLNSRSAFQTALDFGTNFFNILDQRAKQLGNADFWKRLYTPEGAAAAGVSLLNTFEQRFNGAGANPSSGNVSLLDALRRRADALNGNQTIDKDRLKNDIAREQAYLGLLGQTTTALEARRQVELSLQAAGISGISVDAKRAETLKKLAEENVLGITAIKAQADAYRIESATVGMSVNQMTAYAAAQNAINEAKRNGRALSDSDIKRIQEEARVLGQVAEAATRARIGSDIQFGLKTAFLSPDDLAIANQLKTLYGNDVPAALRSTEAAGLRAVNVLQDIARTGQEVTRGFLTDFGQQIRNGANAMDALRTAGLNALSKIADKLLEMAANNLWSSAFGGGGFSISNLFKSIGIPGFAVGTNSAPGGLALVGERGPEIVNLPKGSQVIPNNMLRSGTGGGVTSQVSISIDARGADQGVFARLQGEIAQLKANLPSIVVGSVRDAQKRRVLA